jgi:hypothetical protein
MYAQCTREPRDDGFVDTTQPQLHARTLVPGSDTARARSPKSQGQGQGSNPLSR